MLGARVARWRSVNGAHIALVGRVTRTPELKYAASGIAMLRTSLLVEDAKRRDGDEPVFASVVIWSERAEELAGQIVKGSSLYVEGKVKPSAWTAADGAVKCNLDISAWRAEVLGAIGKSAPRRARQDDDLAGWPD
jgi:single-strand DNA-binding protein